MEIRQLRAFVAIAESGTFTAGAVRVHVTQAAISMQIRQLETEIGARVFVRAPRHVILTEAGEHLLRRARTMTYRQKISAPFPLAGSLLLAADIKSRNFVVGVSKPS